MSPWLCGASAWCVRFCPPRTVSSPQVWGRHIASGARLDRGGQRRFCGSPRSSIGIEARPARRDEVVYRRQPASPLRIPLNHGNSHDEGESAWKALHLCVRSFLNHRVSLCVRKPLVAPVRAYACRGRIPRSWQCPSGSCSSIYGMKSPAATSFLDASSRNSARQSRIEPSMPMLRSCFRCAANWVSHPHCAGRLLGGCPWPTGLLRAAR